jgi:uncharacterized membrane protein YdjX (TVP38/TMEM64 family)
MPSPFPRPPTPPGAAPGRASRVQAVRWAVLAAVLLALILVPFAVAGTYMDAWSVARLQSLAGRPAVVAALVVALLAADVLIPVPSSVVATLAGALLGFAGGLLANLLGMGAGCVAAYAIGRWAGAPAAGRIVGAGQVARLHALARHHGDWSLVLARPVPVLAEASTLLAGAAGMPFGRFMAVTTAANLGIAAAYAAIGAFAASMQSFLLAFAGAILVPVAAKLLLRLRQRNAAPERPSWNRAS